MEPLYFILYFTALLPFAAFFGIAVYMFIAPVYGQLSARTFIELFQALDRRMQVAAPVLLIVQIVLSVAVVGLEAGRRAYGPAAAASAALALSLTSMAIAVRGNVPLNIEMQRWSPDAPPSDWLTIRQRWLHLHYLRNRVEMLGFACMVCAALLHGR